VDYSCFLWITTVVAALVFVAAATMVTAATVLLLFNIAVNIAVVFAFNVDVFGAFLYFRGSVCFGVGLSHGFGRPAQCGGPPVLIRAVAGQYVVIVR